MTIDLDNFKPVNDAFGHRVGDELLIMVAERLMNSLRKEDTVARIGGDEFIIILTDLSSGKDPDKISNKIIRELSRPFHVEGHELNVSCSIGISIYPRDGKDLDTLCKKSDQAMYRAKEQGGNSSFIAEATTG